ncbi:MAG: hypothetical protein QME62_04495 [Armatimonadota bacterium]|nr:hypothetical protein [Armatimonadota bacterium]
MRALILAICFASAVVAVSFPSEATSPQIEWSEPLFLTTGSKSSAAAFFGLVPGSKVYDTAGSLGVTFQKETRAGEGFYFFGDIFTWIKNKGTQFMPRRVIYTIEPGYITTRGKLRWRAFIKHQSFHEIDSFDQLNEMYELYGISFQQVSQPLWCVSVAKYLNRRVVDYRWDLATSVTRKIGSLNENDLYGHIWLHHVTEHRGNAMHRDGFMDYAIESSVDFKNGLIGFLRYEVLHDIERFGGTTDSHFVLGVRIQQ